MRSLLACWLLQACWIASSVDLAVLLEEDARRERPGGGVCLLQEARAARLRARGASASLLPTRDVCTAEGARAFASAIEAAAAPGAAFWSGKGGTLRGSGASSFAARVSVSGGPAWSFLDETASLVTAHPCIDGDRAVYLAHRNGKLRKFSPEGALLWTNTANFQSQREQVVTGGPVLVGDSVVIGSVDGHVTSVNTATGQTSWREKVASAAGVDSWSLAGIAGVGVFVSMRSERFRPDPDFGGADMIIALDPATGRALWRFPIPSEDMIVYNWAGSFAVDPPSLLFATILGRAYRLRVCDGSVVWSSEPAPRKAGEGIGTGTGGLALGPNGLAYVTSNVVGTNGTAYGVVSAHSVATGSRVWTRSVPMQASSAPAVGRLGDADGRLAVVVAIGENPWYPDLLAQAGGLVAKVRDAVEGDSAPTPVAYRSEVLALDAGTGATTAWRFAPPPHRGPEAEGDAYPDRICLPDAWTSPVIDGDGTVYIGHMSGNVFALRDANGNGRLDRAGGEVQSYFGGRCYQGAPGIAPGMLVATPCDGMHVFLHKEDPSRSHTPAPALQ